MHVMTFPSCLADHFQKTARTKIDVHEGASTMEFDGEVIKLNIFDAMRFPADMNYMYALDIIDELSQDIMTYLMKINCLLCLIRVLIMLSFKKCHTRLMVI